MNYSADYNLLGQNLLPPSKRLDVFLAWVAVISGAVQWEHDLIFNDYANGTSALVYNSGTAYSKGNRIIYNQKVYEAKTSTTGNAPTTGDDNDTYWILVLNDFRGVRERVSYNGQKLTLEWILNKWFGTNFVQPDNNFPSIHSDFWIENLITDDNSFLLATDSNSGPSYLALNNNADDYLGLTYQAEVTNFTVHYPLSIVASTSTIQYKQMDSLITKYKLYGTIPQYIGY